MRSTERKQQAYARRFKQLEAKLDDAKAKAEKATVAARRVAGPHGALLDAETLAPIRAATEREMTASLAAAKGGDPIGSITVQGRRCLAVPPWLLEEAPISPSTRPRAHSTRKVRATYVKLKGTRGFNAYAVQLPADNQWGFELAQAEGDWLQSWPGGFGLATEWTAVPKTKVPVKVRSEMDWLFK